MVKTDKIVTHMDSSLIICMVANAMSYHSVMDMIKDGILHIHTHDVRLTHCPLGDTAVILNSAAYISHFQTHIKDRYYEHFPHKLPSGECHKTSQMFS